MPDTASLEDARVSAPHHGGPGPYRGRPTRAAGESSKACR